MEQPIVTDNATLWPVSIKGVVRTERDVLLAFNERREWELLGGKLELGEDPATTVTREIEEESGLTVNAGALLDTWIYEIDQDRRVLIVTYDCPVAEASDVTVSDEHASLRWWPIVDVAKIVMPSGYLRSIEAAVMTVG